MEGVNLGSISNSTGSSSLFFTLVLSCIQLCETTWAKKETSPTKRSFFTYPSHDKRQGSGHQTMLEERLAGVILLSFSWFTWFPLISSSPQREEKRTFPQRQRTRQSMTRFILANFLNWSQKLGNHWDISWGKWVRRLYLSPSVSTWPSDLLRLREKFLWQNTKEILFFSPTLVLLIVSIATCIWQKVNVFFTLSTQRPFCSRQVEDCHLL